MIRVTGVQDPDPSSGSSGPRITPNRQSIDNRFPSLGFIVQVAGRPWYEVLLATDRSLFASTNAAMRTNTNFYSSRADADLMETDGDAVYVVPCAVLRRFAEATPKPEAIYYTAIVYDDAQGGNPMFAHAPERLPVDAPAVRLMSDFTGHSLATTLGISLEKLQRVGRQRHADQTAGDGAGRTEGTGPVVGNGAHGNGAHGNGAHGNGAHGNGAHGNGAHGNGTHGNATLHGRVAPQAAAWSDLSLDEAAGDRAAGEDAFEHYEAVGDHEPASPRHSDDRMHGGHGTSRSAAFTHRGTYSDNLATDRMHADRPDRGSSTVQAPEGVFSVDAPEPSAIDGSCDELEYDDGFNEEPAATSSGMCSDTTAYGDEADELTWDGYQDQGLDYESLEHPSSGNGNGSHLVAPPRPIPTAELTIDSRKDVISRVANLMRRSYQSADFQPQAGLRFGIAGFRQSSGALGELLKRMQEKDPSMFDQVFGPHAGALVRVTGAGQPEDRLKTIGGTGLGDAVWLARFEDAGGHPAFQAAQNEVASGLFIDPMLRFANWLGILTDRGLAMVYERTVDLGVDRAQQWIVDAARVLATPAEQNQVLAAIGQTDVVAFQRSHQIEPDGMWNPMTRAAASEALRRLGEASPVPVPDGQQVLNAMVRQAETDELPTTEFIRALRDAVDFTDAVFVPQ